MITLQHELKQAISAQTLISLEESTQASQERQAAGKKPALIITITSVHLTF